MCVLIKEAANDDRTVSDCVQVSVTKYVVCMSSALFHNCDDQHHNSQTLTSATGMATAVNLIMPPSDQDHISPECTSVWVLYVCASHVFAYLKLYRPAGYHTVPLNCLCCFFACVCVCLFAQLVLCSPYRQHQPNPTAVLPDSEPMCNEGPTLRCVNKLRLLMNTALLPPLSVCQSKHTQVLF